MTLKTFLKRLEANNFNWHIEFGGLIRSHSRGDAACMCPISSILEGGCSQTWATCQLLGLTNGLSHAIICAADNCKSSLHDQSNIQELRKLLLKTYKLEE